MLIQKQPMLMIKPLPPTFKGKESGSAGRPMTLTELYASLAQDISSRNTLAAPRRDNWVGDSLFRSATPSGQPVASSSNSPSITPPPIVPAEALERTKSELVDFLIPAIISNQKILIDNQELIKRQQNEALEREKELADSPNLQESKEASLIQEEEARENKRDYNKAKQSLIQTSLGAAGLASGALVVKSLVAAGTVVLAPNTTLLMMIAGMGYSIINTISSLFSNSQTKNVIRDLKTKTKSFATTIWGKLKSGFGAMFSKKKTVTFGGSQQQEKFESKPQNQLEAQPVNQVQSIDSKQKQIITQVTERYAHIFNAFSLKPLQMLTEDKQIEALQDMENELVRTNLELVEKAGGPVEKAKAQIAKKFLNDVKTLTASLPDQFESYAELPLDKQNLLREMIFDTLTSGTENLVDWGKTQGKLIGMTPENIQSVISHTPSHLLN